MQSSPRIDELKQKFHENPRRYFAPLANEYRKAGDPDQAIAICRAHLAQQPGHMSGHVVYGQALYDAGRIDEARIVFQQALALDPENLIVLRHLGDIARRRGDVEEARSWYSRTLDGDPQDAEVAAYLAELTEPVIVSGAAESVTSASPAASLEAPSPTTAEEIAEKPAPAPAEAPTEDSETAQTESKIEEESLVALPMSAEPAPVSDSAFADLSLIEDAEAAASPYADVTSSAKTSGESQISDDSPYLEEAGATDAGAEAAPVAEAGLSDSSAENALAEAASADMEAEGAPSPPPAEPEPVRADRGFKSTPTFESTPIITRTLAELYLQQGYIEPALEIYRQLAEREPEDAGLRERITELSGVEGGGTSRAPEESSAPEMPAADSAPLALSEAPATGEVSEKELSSELWDTADSWSFGMLDESGDTDEIFGLSAMDDGPMTPAPEAPALDIAEGEAAEVETAAALEPPVPEAPGAKTPAAEVPAEEKPEGHPAAAAPEPRGITIREFFATLGAMRPPATDASDDSDQVTSSDVEAGEAHVPPATQTDDEDGYPYADDAFASLFGNMPVSSEDSRAATALSGAVAHVPPASPVASSTEPRPGRDARPARPGEQPAQETEEDIRRFREWLEGLANS